MKLTRALIVAALLAIAGLLATAKPASACIIIGQLSIPFPIGQTICP